MRKPMKTENESNVNIVETDPKYSEIPLHFLVFEGFPIILEKRRKRTQTHFWVRFRVEAFPCWGVSIAPLFYHRIKEFDFHELKMMIIIIIRFQRYRDYHYYWRTVKLGLVVISYFKTQSFIEERNNRKIWINRM